MILRKFVLQRVDYALLWCIGRTIIKTRLSCFSHQLRNLLRALVFEFPYFLTEGEKQGQWLCMFVPNALQIVFYPILMAFGSNSIYQSIPFSQLEPVLAVGRCCNVHNKMLGQDLTARILRINSQLQSKYNSFHIPVVALSHICP